MSTFPFLAVLLCAMGALILLLLVIDRRAKVVARHKAREALEQAQAAALAKKATQLDAHQADWERQRQALHDLLARQYQGLRGEIDNIQNQAAATERILQDELTRIKSCEQHLTQVKVLLAQDRAALESRRKALGEEARKDNVSRSELERMAREVAQLEQTLLALRAVRQQDHSTYSLVPYKGRRGDARQPIYIECNAAGIVVHPERLAVERDNGLEIRRVVQERVEALMPARGEADAKAAAAYLLMLIRPDGIPSYYRAQAALQGLKLDFGYELIDRDWVLDFSADEKANQQPWRVARVTPPASPIASRPAQEYPPPRYHPAPPPQTPMTWGPAERPTSGPMDESQGRGPHAGPLFPRGPYGSGVPRSPLSAGMPMTSPGPRGVPGVEQPATSSILASILTPHGVPGSGGSPRPQTQGPAAPGRSENMIAPPMNLQPPDPHGSLTGHGTLSDRTGQGPGQRPAANGPPATAMTEAPPEQPRSGFQLRPPIPLPQDTQAKTVPPSPLSRLLGNRDFNILLECTAETIVIHPSGKKFQVAELPTWVDPQTPLVRTVHELIARRQATVQPGEPPYRPVLKFRVGPGGLRAYYRAYPLLEILRLPMSREDVE